MIEQQVRSSPARYRVQRWTPLNYVATAGLGALILALVFVPPVLGTTITQQLASLLSLVILAVMWNTLAGYGGLVSVGQQAFIGLGAYGTIYLARQGMAPYLAMALAAIAAGVIAVPTSFLVLRLRGGQFAIGTWVVAEVFSLLVALDQSLGGGTGISLTQLDVYAPDRRQAYTYWWALAAATILLSTVIVLLRSRLGASLRAIRDDEDAAASVGISVMRSKRVLFVLAALGCGAAGALILANTLFVDPTTAFGVQWSAYMIFMVLVGGLGTVEGPVLGAILFFLLQNRFADYGAWYLVGLGGVAIVFALFLPRGLWGEVERRFRIQLVPIGYVVRPVTDRTSPAGHAAGTPESGDNE